MLVKSLRGKPWPLHNRCVSDSMTTIRRRFLRTKTDVGDSLYYNRLLWSHLFTVMREWTRQTTCQSAQACYSTLFYSTTQVLMIERTKGQGVWQHQPSLLWSCGRWFFLRDTITFGVDLHGYVILVLLTKLSMAAFYGTHIIITLKAFECLLRTVSLVKSHSMKR